MTEVVLFLLMVLSVVAAGFFAGTETGFLAVPRVRLVSAVRQGNVRAKRLAEILKDMSKALTTLLVGNNLASVLFSTISASLGMHLFTTSAIWRSCWSLCAALTMLFCGEYLPKLLFSSRPLERSMLASGPYSVARGVLSPLVTVFGWIVGKVFKLKPQRAGRLGVSRDGLRKLVADGQDSTRLTQFERRLIDRVLMLQTTRAKDLLHSASAQDLEILKASRRPGKEGYFHIPASTRGDDILPLMRRRRSPVALVVDEAGRELGVVTEEDVLLALTGVLKLEA